MSDDIKNLQNKVVNHDYSQELVLRKCGSSNLTDDIARISLDLKVGKDLRSLQFHSIYSGLNQIFKALQQNRSLIRLKLYNFQANDDDDNDDSEGFKSISNCLHDNITMKTLQLHFDDKQDKDQSFLNKDLISQILIDLEDNVGVTTLHLENWNKDTEIINALCTMLKKNTTLLHLGLFHSIDKNLEIQDIEKISSSLEYNKSLRVLYLGTRSNIKINKDILTSDIRNLLESLTRKRSISLIVRTDNKDYVFGSIRNMPVPPTSQWEVEDEVEVLCEEDQWEKGIIISVSSDYRYSVLLKSGQIKLHCRAQLTRSRKDFQRYSIIPFVSDSGKSSKQEEFIADEGMEENPIPDMIYEVGQQVEVRYYGDSEWNQATVLSISFPVLKSSTALLVLSVELGDDFHRSKEVVEVESFLVRPVDAIMYLPTPTELYYDAGIYKRGDYVEVNSRIVHSDVANDEGSVTFEWKRGRIAIDKKNGTYDVRMENGKDALAIKASRLRHHFRSKDTADCRIKHSLEWKLVMIDKQDKDGTYIITYENGEQEMGVSARRLMPSSRNHVRENAENFGVKVLSPTFKLELVQSSRLPPNRQVIDQESPSSKGKQSSSSTRRVESSRSPARLNSEQFKDNQSDHQLSSRRDSTKSTKISGANEETESLKLGEKVFDEEDQDLESKNRSSSRRESSRGRSRREPEDPIDPNAIRNERRSSSSKRGESTAPDDKDRRSGRRSSSSSSPRRESSSSPVRNPEDPIDPIVVINNQDKQILANNDFNNKEIKPPADIRSSAKSHTPVRKGSKLVMKESDVAQLQRDLSKLRPPTPAARNIEIRIGSSLNLFNKMSNTFEQCLVTCIYDDGTFDASNSNGDVYEHVDERYIDPDSFKIAISRTPVQMHPSNDMNHNLGNSFPFQQQNKKSIMYKTGTYVEVYYRDANTPSSSLGIWLSGVIVRKITEEQYLVLLDQEHFDGANNIECVYHISEIRKVNKNVENSFEGGKQVFELKSYGVTEHNQYPYTPQVLPHVITTKNEGSMQSYQVRPKTAPDNRYGPKLTNMNLFSQTSTNFPISVPTKLKQHPNNEILNTITVASEVAAADHVQDSSEFGVVFKSHCAPMQWLPIIVFFQSSPKKYNSHINSERDDNHDLSPTIDDVLQPNTDIIVCPSCEHADFSNDIDNFQSVIHWYENGPGDRASCLLFICFRADAPTICPAKITLYIKSLIVCELYFHVITNTNNATNNIPTGSVFDHLTPQRDYHKILKYSMEAKSAWEMITAPMITSLYVLCIYDDDTINDDLLIEALDAMPSHIIITIAESESNSVAATTTIFDNHIRHTKYNRNIIYEKVQVMLFLQNRNSNLTMDWWKGLKKAHLPLAESLYSTGMSQRLIQSKQNKLAISISMRGSILDSGSYDNLRYEWLLNTLGIKARNVTSVSNVISLQRWCYHRGIQNEETISTSIALRIRFIRSQQLLYNMIQSFDVTEGPIGLLLLPTAAIIPSQKPSITKNTLLNTIRSNSKDKFEIHHKGALNKQHHAWEIHLLCDGSYPLTATGAKSIPISSLTSVIPVDIESTYLNLPFVNAIIPLMKVTIAMLIAHITAASLNTPGLIFPGYITNISKLFDVQSLLELYNYYSELEITYISNRFNHIPQGKQVITAKTPTIPALPTTFGTYAIIGTEDFEAALRCAVAYLEDTILCSMQQDIHKSLSVYNNFIQTKSLLDIEGGRVKRYDMDKSIYFSKVFPYNNKISIDVCDCWRSLLDITTKSKQMSVEDTIARYEIDYRNHCYIRNSELQSSTIAISNNYMDSNMVNSPNPINIHQKAINNSNNKQKDLQSTLLQMLVNDIGINDMIQAQEIVNCLISQGCTSYADFILLGSIFINKNDGSVNNEQLRSLFHHSGIPLFIAAKLAAFIEIKLK